METLAATNSAVVIDAKAGHVWLIANVVAVRVPGVLINQITRGQSLTVLVRLVRTRVANNSFLCQKTSLWSDREFLVGEETVQFIHRTKRWILIQTVKEVDHRSHIKPFFDHIQHTIADDWMHLMLAVVQKSAFVVNIPLRPSFDDLPFIVQLNEFFRLSTADCLNQCIVIGVGVVEHIRLVVDDNVVVTHVVFDE